MDLVKFLIILSALLLLNACTTSKYSIDSYKKVNKEIGQKYKLKRPDLVTSYDLARLDNTSCIYSAELGLFANEKNYADAFLQKFANKYKSVVTLKNEAKKKVAKISKFLLNIHKKHKILNNSELKLVHHYLHHEPKKRNYQQELAKLDEITRRIPLMIPAYNPSITSHYGNRLHPICKKYKFHYGLDLATKVNNPIYASANGKVITAGASNGYGLMVELDHGKNIKTKYAHLSKILVKNGEHVIRGQVLGLQGRTGNATSDHLHFEIYIAGSPINPYDLISQSYQCVL